MTGNARELLELRLAKGEISVEEFEKILHVLEKRELSVTARETLAEPIPRNEEPLVVIDDIKLYLTYISNSDGIRDLTDVLKVSGWNSTASFNFIPAYKNSVLEISFASYPPIKLSESRTVFGRGRHDVIQKFSSIVKQLTLKNRVSRLVDRLKNAGYVDLCSNNGEFLKKVTLYKNGTLESRGLKFLISECCTVGLFLIGTERHSWNGLNQSFDSNEVVISDKVTKINSTFPSDAIRFSPFLEDVDVVHVLLKRFIKSDFSL